MINVSLSNKAERDLRSIPRSDRTRIQSAISALETSFFPEGCDIKKMKGFTDSYRLRVGNWRILYRIHFSRKEVYIGGILRREQAYR